METMPPATLSAIEFTERTLGRRLPPHFREFLLRHNGAEVECLELTWEVGPVESIVSDTESARKWQSFPRGGISIGEDGCGNHLVFVPSAADGTSFDSSLYAWWHEGGELELNRTGFIGGPIPREDGPDGTTQQTCPGST